MRLELQDRARRYFNARSTLFGRSCTASSQIDDEVTETPWKKGEPRADAAALTALQIR